MPNTSLNAIAEREPHLATSRILLQTIVVAADFSPQSAQALKEAISIARCFGSQILLVHGATPTVFDAGAETMLIDCYKLELDAAKAKMEELIAGEPDLQGFSHREFVAYRRAVDLVKQVAVENTADLVVAGSHGAGGLELLALGSVAESILSQVPCPVLIVGPHCTAETHPFRSILFTTDLEETGLRSAQFASAFAERFHSPLTMLHVVEKKSRRFRGQSGLTEEHIRQELSRLLPDDLAIYTTATTRVEHGKAGKVIPDVARSLHASLIITGFAPHALGDRAPWSTLSQVIRQSPCPVLSVRSHPG
jgi:nucleotide-binding universal stress UspA family protein